MESQKVSVSFFLDASRPSADGKCLIKLNIYNKPDKKRYATIFHATPREWEKLNGSNLRDEALKDIKSDLNALQNEAEEVIKELKPFSFVCFEEAFFKKQKVKKSSNLKQWFDDYISRLNELGRVGTAISYRNSYNSLNDFRKNLSVHDITVSFLESYENHMTTKNRSMSTVGIYLRNLRGIINQAIKAKVMLHDKYPFREYQIPTGRNVKKALAESDISKLVNYTPANLDEQKALDFWVLSYLCSGMNFADLVELKPANINGSHLHFFRAKTRNTKKKDLRPVKVGLNPMAKTIIEKWKTTDPANPYLFPILEAGLTPLTIKYRCQRFIKWVNERMDIIRKELKIEQKVGTYVARHSFSTLLKRKGVSTEFIKEALGHSSIATTENYLDSFEDNVTLEYANLLTDLVAPAPVIPISNGTTNLAQQSAR